MNEITKIHLGRQPFVIAIDAHKALQEYLQEIKRHVGKNGGVVDEIEIRMAELLAERGISGDKVVLLEDVAFLKEQLGAPRDFEDDDTTGGATSDADTSATDGQPEPGRRLFRDTEHGTLGGVSSGIANYFNIDAVIVRILFVIATVTGGWGIPVYIVMWLVTPEARTASERLQMRGKAVTVDSLKEIVGRAQVTGVAHHASRKLVTIIEVFAKTLLAITGVLVSIVAIALLGGMAVAVAHAFMHNGHLIYGAIQFPLGGIETTAVAGGFAVLASIAAFLLATGIAMVRRKWSVPGWVVASFAGLFMLGMVVGGAAAADTVQNVHGRYESSVATDTRTLEPFDKVRVIQGAADVPVNYESTQMADRYGDWNTDDMPDDIGDLQRPIVPAGTDGVYYEVKIRHVKTDDVSKIKTTVKDRVLTIDTRSFAPGGVWDCDGFCMGNKDYFSLTVQTAQPVKELPVR